MIEDEASKGKFLSREDFKNRCKVSEKVVETMADLGLMEDLPHSNQISLMDFMERCDRFGTVLFAFIVNGYIRTACLYIILYEC